MTLIFNNLKHGLLSLTYDVNDLLEGDSERQQEGLRLVDHRPFQRVVVGDQVVEQLLLVVAAHRFYERNKKKPVLNRFWVSSTSKTGNGGPKVERARVQARRPGPFFWLTVYKLQA